MGSFQIVIPCYNYARYLRECVESVLSQPVELRILIIDDCSSDETPEVGRSLVAADSRIDFIRHAENKGHIATFNEGIAQARGDYFVLLSADNMLTPNALGRAAAVFEKNAAVGLVYGHAAPLYGNTLPHIRMREAGWTLWKGRDWIERACRTGRNFIRSPEAVLRLDIQQRLGGYNPQLRHTGDMEMWLRAAALADVGRINGADQAYYRVHASNMHLTGNGGRLSDLESRRNAILSAFSHEVGLLPEAAELRQTACRSLATEAIRLAGHAIDHGEAKSACTPYQDFARAVWPEILLTRRWRTLARRLHASSPSPVMRCLRTGMWRAGEKMAWRRWWRTGVY